MTRLIVLLAAGVAITAVGVSAHAQVADAPAAAPTPAQTSDFRMFEPTAEEWEKFRSSTRITQQGGEAVYNAVCAGCHMPQGKGAIGAGKYPALADNDLLAGAAYPIHLVVNGQRAMPPFGGLLDDRQVADVVNFIRSSFGNDFIAEHGQATPEDVTEFRP
jgi:mono/diheme cytochrome c family protein